MSQFVRSYVLHVQNKFGCNPLQQGQTAHKPQPSWPPHCNTQYTHSLRCNANHNKSTPLYAVGGQMRHCRKLHTSNLRSCNVGSTIPLSHSAMPPKYKTKYERNRKVLQAAYDIPQFISRIDCVRSACLFAAAAQKMSKALQFATPHVVNSGKGLVELVQTVFRSKHTSRYTCKSKINACGDLCAEHSHFRIGQ